MSHLFLFSNTRLVIKADGILTRAGGGHTIMPVPLHITSECGMCIRPGKPESQHQTLLQMKIAHEWIKEE